MFAMISKTIGLVTLSDPICPSKSRIIFALCQLILIRRERFSFANFLLIFSHHSLKFELTDNNKLKALLSRSINNKFRMLD